MLPDATNQALIDKLACRQGRRPETLFQLGKGLRPLLSEANCCRSKLNRKVNTMKPKIEVTAEMIDGVADAMIPPVKLFEAFEKTTIAKAFEKATASIPIPAPMAALSGFVSGLNVGLSIAASAEPSAPVETFKSIPQIKPQDIARPGEREDEMQEFLHSTLEEIREHSPEFASFICATIRGRGDEGAVLLADLCLIWRTIQNACERSSIDESLSSIERASAPTEIN